MGGVWAISIKKQYFDTRKSTMKIRHHENISLYDIQIEIGNLTKLWDM